MIKKILSVLICAVFATANALAAYPERSITLVVPFPAGGPADAVGRVLAREMGALLGQPVIVENKSGAGGLIGIAAVAHAQADGYTLGMAGTGAMVYAPFMTKKMPFQPLEDLSLLTTLVRTPNAVVVRAASPLRSMNDLMQAAQVKALKISYASAGVGSSAHVVGEMLQRQANIKLLHIPYKGAAPAIQDLLSGQVDIMIGEASGITAQVSAGSLRALAISDSKRLATLPDVPSANEVGLPDWLADGAYGLVGPRGLANEVAERILSAATTALASPEVRKRIADMSSIPVSGNPKQYRELLSAEQARWMPVIRGANITAE